MNRSALPVLMALCALTCASALAQNNGGFENGLNNWTATPAGSATILDGTTPEAFFPSQGNQYAQLITFGNGVATPGYGPHAAGSGAGFVSQLSRTFVRPAGSVCSLSIDWTFFQDEGDDDATYNDFMSIDLFDDATGAFINNVVFVDTGTLAGTPFYTNVPGAGAGDPVFVRSAEGTQFLEVAPQGFKRAQLDISGTAEGQVLRLEISVGNTTDQSVPCRALIDNFRVRGGGVGFSEGRLRVLGSTHVDGLNSSSDSGGDFASGRFQRRVLPNEPLVLRAEGPSGLGGTPWALLSGLPAQGGIDFGFGDFSLVVASAEVVFDGINPSTVGDALLGTLNEGANFITAAAPAGVAAGVIGLQGVMVDPTNGPLFISATPLTELEFAGAPQMPVGDADVLDAGGSTLGDDDTGIVDLTPIGGFDFYGVNYTEVFVNSNGNLTFGSGDTDFSETVDEFLSQEPRIAVIWDDYDPPETGNVRFAVAPNLGSVTVSWTGIDQFGDGVVGANNFAVQLFQDGTITCHYQSLTSFDGLVGISPGALPVLMAPSNGADLSALFAFHDGNRSTVAPGTAFWQDFQDGIGTTTTSDYGTDFNDLATLGNNGPSRITYVPDGLGGYTVFCGTR